MPNGSIYPLTINDEDYLEELVRSLPDNITIKDTSGYTQLLRDIGLAVQPDLPTDLSLKDSAAELRQSMQDSGVDRYISFEKIASMLKREYKSKDEPLSPPLGTRVLLGLADKNNLYNLDNLMKATSAYWNALGPTKQLKKATKKHSRSYVPDLHVDRYHPTEWVAQSDEAHALLTANDLAGAIAAYDAMFATMHRKQTVTVSVYRLITNAAVAHLVAGDLILGLDLLREALRICPNYDFALQQQQLIDDGAYMAGSLQKVIDPELPVSSPIMQYIIWFDSLGIDLSGGDGHQTRTTMQDGSNKIGRNELCPCGSAKKYKKCHGSVV